MLYAKPCSLHNYYATVKYVLCYSHTIHIRTYVISDWLQSSAKSSHVCTQIEIHRCPSLWLHPVHSITMHAHSLLANVNWSAFLEYICQIHVYRSMTGEMVPMECSKSSLIAFCQSCCLAFSLAVVTTHPAPTFPPPHIYAGLKLMNSLKIVSISYLSARLVM